MLGSGLLLGYRTTEFIYEDWAKYWNCNHHVLWFHLPINKNEVFYLLYMLRKFKQTLLMMTGSNITKKHIMKLLLKSKDWRRTLAPHQAHLSRVKCDWLVSRCFAVPASWESRNERLLAPEYHGASATVAAAPVHARVCHLLLLVSGAILWSKYRTASLRLKGWGFG